jgi:hypothetical protein
MVFPATGSAAWEPLSHSTRIAASRKSSSTANCRSPAGMVRVIAPRGVIRSATCQP